MDDASDGRQVEARRGVRRLRRWQWSLLVLAVVLVAAGISILGGHKKPIDRPTVPAALGRDGNCYYVRSAEEAVQLKRLGACPASSVPAPMPASWLFAYYPFYNSRFYTGTFVAPADRAGYSSYMQAFDQRYAAQIDQDAPKARYVNGAGDEVTGSAAGVNSADTSISGDNNSSDSYHYAGDDGGD